MKMTRETQAPGAPTATRDAHAPPLERAETRTDIRCERCNRKLAEMATSPWCFVCPRCKCRNTNGAPAAASEA